MDVADVVVVVSAAVLIAALGWFFFGPRRARTARLEGGVQRVEVTVRGGYSPMSSGSARGCRIIAAAMALSSLSVVTNASRLRRWHSSPLPPAAAAAEPGAEPRTETPADHAPHSARTPEGEVSDRRP
ncbi:hypothetical protein ACF05L_09365 [Streptomyces bobili]|uniref:hypothetical protein n=1 Tax=Streptomyces bobili TaxID=67280 RepID=UPI0036F5F707